MSSIYAPTAAKLGSITIPEDNVDYVKASAINPALQAIADGVKHENVRRWWAYSPTIDDTVNPIATVTENTYTDVVQLLSAQDVAVGDTVHALYTVHAACTGSMTMRLAVGPSRIPLFNSFAFRSSSADAIVPITMQGVTTLMAQMLNSGKLDVYLQAKVAAPGSLVVWAPHGLSMEIERP